MPIGFYALPEVIEDINRMNGDCLKYYGDILQCISVRGTSHIKIDNIDIDLINNNPDRNITFYVIRERSKKSSMHAATRNHLRIMNCILTPKS